MARKPRIEFPGAFYHVITRGNQKQKVFRAPEDQQKYLKVLASYKQRYRFLLHVYVLMGNHVHLLLETQETPLSRILQGINQSYTMYFNRKYKTVGHLFQGRYKAILCDRDEYLLGLVKYIHLNPVRAQKGGSIDAYPWSSHHAYAGRGDTVNLVDTDMALGMLSKRRATAWKAYLAFMEESPGLTKEHVYATVDQRLQGDEEFINWVKERHAGEVREVRLARQYTLPQIAEAVERIFGVTAAELRSDSRIRVTTRARKVFACAAKTLGYRMVEIARFLEKDPSAVTGYGKADMAEEVEWVVGLLRGQVK